MFEKICILAAIVGIIFIEYTALQQGINGTALSLSIAAVAGLAGYKFESLVKLIKGKK